MSGKANRKLRQQLSKHRFPAVTETHGATPVAIKPGYLTPGYKVEINHNRRVVRLAKSAGIQLEKAVERHVQRHGMMPKLKTE